MLWLDRWIQKKISETQLAQRLSPRRKRSSWTELNKERVRRLEKLGFMHDEGRKVLPVMDPSAFIIDGVIEQRLKEDHQVYANFMAFPTHHIKTFGSIRSKVLRISQHYSRSDWISS